MSKKEKNADELSANENDPAKSGDQNQATAQPQTATAQPPAQSIPLTNEQRKAVQKDKYDSLKNKMISGEDLPTIKANKAKGREIREDESNLMHIEVNQKMHDKSKKTYRDNKRVVILSVTHFQQMELDKSFAIYDEVEILHDPRTKEQIKEFEALKEKRAKQLQTPTASK